LSWKERGERVFMEGERKRKRSHGIEGTCGLQKSKIGVEVGAAAAPGYWC